MFMVKVIFICLGNICRSPMAEFVFKKMVAERGLQSCFDITSRGTSDCEEGSCIYPPAQRELNLHGVQGDHRAKKLSFREIENCDYALVMDGSNFDDVLRLTGGKYAHKVFKLCSFTDCPRDVADPWYTRDFSRAYADIEEGCRAFLDFILREGNIKAQ